MKDNNVLYKNIIINLDFIDTWEGEFVSVGMLSRVLQYDKDIQKKKGFVVDLKMDNFENDFHHAANNLRIVDSGLLNGCLYINVDNT